MVTLLKVCACLLWFLIAFVATDDDPAIKVNGAPLVGWKAMLVRGVLTPLVGVVYLVAGVLMTLPLWVWLF